MKWTLSSSPATPISTTPLSGRRSWGACLKRQDTGWRSYRSLIGMGTSAILRSSVARGCILPSRQGRWTRWSTIIRLPNAAVPTMPIRPRVGQGRVPITVPSPTAASSSSSIPMCLSSSAASRHPCGGSPIMTTGRINSCPLSLWIAVRISLSMAWASKP